MQLPTPALGVFEVLCQDRYFDDGTHHRCAWVNVARGVVEFHVPPPLPHPFRPLSCSEKRCLNHGHEIPRDGAVVVANNA